MTTNAHITTGNRASTPFLAFWAALAEQCRLNGMPEPTYGPAQRAWGAAVRHVVTEKRA